MQNASSSLSAPEHSAAGDATAATDALASQPQPSTAASLSQPMQHDSVCCPELASPCDVAALAEAAASSNQSSDAPTTPLTQPSSCAASSSCGPQRASPRSPSARTPSPAPSLTHSDAGDLSALAAEAAAATAACTLRRRSTIVQIDVLVERMQQRPVTGQVVAWGWDAAAVMSGVRRTMPAQVFSSLWPATLAAAQHTMMPQDVLEMLESWLTLMQQCPRHFRLAKEVLQALATYAMPAAVKRMSEAEVARLATLARDIALHPCDALVQGMGGHSCSGASARDLVQPLFSLAAAEVAWRCNNPARYVSAEAVSAVVTAAPAWSWRVVRHRDSQALASLKLATAAALEELFPHSPRDLAQSGAFGKLKMPLSPCSRGGSSVSGSSMRGGGSGAGTSQPRALAI